MKSLKSKAAAKHPPKKPRHPVRGCLLSVAIVLSLLLTLGGGAVGVILEPYTHAKMDMTLLDIPRNNRPARIVAYTPEERSTRSGDTHPAKGCELTTTGNDSFTPYEDIPPRLVNAFIAIEDKRFRQHRGVDVLRTAHATLRYLMGNPTFGGSTITQQLIKNLTGEDESTPERKLTEIFRAWDLEQRLDKNSILEAYLNVINLGSGCTGVGMAAERYFSKTPAELTLAECASIAAITQNPSRYDPLRHPEENRRRRDLILYRMEEEGYITPDERDEALATPLTLRPAESKGDTTPVSWYADLVATDVIRDLMTEYGYTYTAASKLFYGGGLTVETVMDETLQTILEDFYRDLSHFPEGDNGIPSSAFILLDPRTGDILAVAGAVGEKAGNRLQSYATDTRRPAGSCIKPLTVYAPAIKEGLVTWSTRYEDTPLTQKNGRPWPSNADGLYRGHVTVARSVALSINTVAVEILEQVGEERAFAFARDSLGMTNLIHPSEGDSHDLTVSSLALGQQSRGVTLRELTAAYTVFYEGIHHPARSYSRVLDDEGKVLLETPQTKKDPVLTRSEAALMTKLLSTVTTEGTAARYLSRIPALGIQAAGKTGTTQNNCDRRFVGYTPNLLGGVWMGYDYPTALTGIEGNPCVRIWDEVMASCTQAYRGAPIRPCFDIPADLVEVEFCPLSGELPGDYCTNPINGQPTEMGWFIQGTQPTKHCTLHEEPPIPLRPEDPTDPDRIPSFPNDILPEAESENETTPQRDAPKPPSFRGWLSRFFGGR